MTHIHTNKTAQTENVLNSEVILKGWIFGQEQTRLFKQAKGRIFRQLRMSKEKFRPVRLDSVQQTQSGKTHFPQQES